MLATLFLGANDACIPDMSPGASSSQHVPVDEYEQYIRTIVRYLKSVNPDMVVILVTPPTLDSSKWPNRSPKVTAQYADSIRRVASEKELGVDLLDLWPNLAMEDPSLSSLSSVPNTFALGLDDMNDGLHLNASGNKKVLDGIKDIIRRRHPRLCPEDLKIKSGSGPDTSKFHYPQWDRLAMNQSDGISTESGYKQILSEWEWEWDWD